MRNFFVSLGAAVLLVLVCILFSPKQVEAQTCGLQMGSCSVDPSACGGPGTSESCGGAHNCGAAYYDSGSGSCRRVCQCNQVIVTGGQKMTGATCVDQTGYPVPPASPYNCQGIYNGGYCQQVECTNCGLSIPTGDTPPSCGQDTGTAKYLCSSGSCIRDDVNGTMTDATCGNSCGGPPVCNNNGICESGSGETTANCPNDCHAGSPDFNVTITPSSQTVSAGGSATYIGSINRVNGYDGGIKSFFVNCASASTCSTTPLDYQEKTTITVTTSGSTPVGSNPFQLVVFGCQPGDPFCTSTSFAITRNATAAIVIPATCPTSGNSVTVNGASSATINVNGTATAAAPSNWTGGNFSSSNPSVASVSNSTITGLEGGVSGGATTITGSGWTAPNGATGCTLSSGATVIVRDFTISAAATPTTFTQGNSSIITVTANSVNSGTMSVTVTPPASASLPSGWSISPATATITAGGSTASFTLTAPAGSAIGTNSITFTGNYSGHTHTGATNVTAAAPLPTISFAASPSSVSFNGSATLTWSTTDATSCTASGSWSGSKATSGSQSTGSLSSSQSYSLTCTGPGGSVGPTTVTVTVGGPPSVSITLSASPNPTNYNTPTTLTWSVSNATACSSPDMPSGNWTSASSGSAITGNLTTATTYHLNCTGPGAPGSAQVTVTIPAAPTVAFSASPTSISYNTASTLTWSTTNATSCTASGSWSGSKATSGSQSTGNLTASQSYGLTCTGAGGSVGPATATVTVGAPPAVTVSLVATPSSISYNSAATLSYTINNATACTSPDMPSGSWSSATNGSVSTGNITSTTTYHLNCTGAGSPGSNVVTVTVGSAPPSVSLTASPTSVAFNGISTLTWTLSNATSCTNNNGNIPAGNWSTGTSGSVSTGALSTSQVYSLTCTGPGGSTGPITATVAVGSSPVCPAGAVSLSGGGTVDVTQTITASAPVGGWSGGTFASNNPSAAVVNSSTGVVTGVEGSASGGISSISGSGWTAPNGATNCPLSGTVATVRDFNLSAGFTPASFTAGNSSIITVTIGAVNSGNMSVTVTPPAPASLPSGWSISPASASNTAGNTVTFTLTTTSAATPGTQNITFTGTYGSHSHTGSGSVTVGAAPTAVSVAMSASPNPVNSNSSATLSYTITNATACTSPDMPNGSWTSGASGSVASPNLIVATTYHLNCTGSGTPGSGQVTVNVNGAPGDTCTGAGCGSCSGGVCSGGGNSSNSVVVGTATCPVVGLILSWQPGANATSYNIYRNTSNSIPGSVYQNVLAQNGNVGTQTYTDNVASGSYFYWVRSLNGSTPSADYVAATPAPLTPNTCDASLFNSDKDIVAINATNVSPAPSVCNNQSDLPNSNTLLHLGDIVTFQINLCNSSVVNSATHLQITDTLTNLQQPAGGWNMQYYNGSAWVPLSQNNAQQTNCPNPAPTSGQYTVCGTAPNQTITINLTGSGFDVPLSGVRNLRMDGQVSVSSGSVIYGRVQNSAAISYYKNSVPALGSKTAATPLILFYNGSGIPDRRETK